jgi:hypothetical protein
MILRGDIAQRGAQINARLIDAAVAKLHLVRLGARGQCQQLEGQMAGLIKQCGVGENIAFRILCVKIV